MIKILVYVMVAACVFAVGIAAGYRSALRRVAGGDAFFGMYGQRQSTAEDQRLYAPRWQMMQGGGMMGQFVRSDDAEWGATATMTNMFGSVSRIEGNKITLMDNGSVEHIVISQSSTVIGSASGVMGLSELTPGQKIDVFGTLDANNQLRAKIIRVF